MHIECNNTGRRANHAKYAFEEASTMLTDIVIPGEIGKRMTGENQWGTQQHPSYGRMSTLEDKSKVAIDIRNDHLTNTWTRLQTDR